MVTELEAWSARCSGVLADLERDIAEVKRKAAEKRRADAMREQQIKSAEAAVSKSAGAPANTGYPQRSSFAADDQQAFDSHEDMMDVDEGMSGRGGARKHRGGFGFRKRG